MTGAILNYIKHIRMINNPKFNIGDLILFKRGQEEAIAKIDAISINIIERVDGEFNLNKTPYKNTIPVYHLSGGLMASESELSTYKNAN